MATIPLKQLPDNINVPNGAKAIFIGRTEFTLVDESDYDWLTQWNWLLQNQNGRKYARRFEGEGGAKIVYMHRQIMGNPIEYTDHINGDGLDNRRINLRICTQSENMQNKDKASSKRSSKYKGVEANTGKWSVRMSTNNARVYLGMYDSEELAAKIYDIHTLKYQGRFAATNFHLSDEEQSELWEFYEFYRGLTGIRYATKHKYWTLHLKDITCESIKKERYIGSFPTEYDAYSAKMKLLKQPNDFLNERRSEVLRFARELAVSVEFPNAS